MKKVLLLLVTLWYTTFITLCAGLLHNAVLVRDVAKIGALLSDSAIDINEYNTEGKTALHCAIDIKSLTVVEMLLEYGAAVYMKTKSCDDPLDAYEYAVQKKIKCLEFSGLLEDAEEDYLLYTDEIYARMTDMLLKKLQMQEFAEVRSRNFHHQKMPPS